MSRLGIAYQVAEAVMGHTLPGVSGIYDRHSYEPEKANALARLASLIEQIVDPTDNVLPMTPRAVM